MLGEIQERNRANRFVICNSSFFSGLNKILPAENHKLFVNITATYKSDDHAETSDSTLSYGELELTLAYRSRRGEYASKLCKNVSQYHQIASIRTDE